MRNKLLISFNIAFSLFIQPGTPQPGQNGKQVSRHRTAGIGTAGTGMARTGHPGQCEPRAGDRNAGAGQKGKNSRDRTNGTEQSEQNSQDTAAKEDSRCTAGQGR
jgi:hypothetical protein